MIKVEVEIDNMKMEFKDSGKESKLRTAIESAIKETAGVESVSVEFENKDTQSQMRLYSVTVPLKGYSDEKQKEVVKKVEVAMKKVLGEYANVVVWAGLLE